MKKAVIRSLFTLILFLLSIISTPLYSQEVAPNVYTIDISGEVDPGMAAYVERALRDIPKESDNIIIFNI